MRGRNTFYFSTMTMTLCFFTIMSYPKSHVFVYSISDLTQKQTWQVSDVFAFLSIFMSRMCVVQTAHDTTNLVITLISWIRTTWRRS